MEEVAELHAPVDDGAVREVTFFSVDEDAEALGAELGGVKVVDHLALLGEPHHLLAVDALGHRAAPEPSTTAMVRSLEILISLEPRSPSGPPVCNLVTRPSSRPSLRQQAHHVLVDGARGHAVLIVRDAAPARRLAGGERLPEVGAAAARVGGGPVHEVGGALVGAEEQDLVLVVVVDHLGLDAGNDGLGDEVEHRVDVLLKAELGAVRPARARAGWCPWRRPRGCPCSSSAA